jgi:5-oxoprolinase (ATP-hydrolysing)
MLELIQLQLLHGAVFPAHEIELGKVAKEMGFSHITLSHQAIPMVRLVLRGNTACVDAYLTPQISSFVTSFLQGFTSPKDVNVLFMKSDGGLEEARRFSGHRAILSGPAGGVNGFSKTAFSQSSKALVSFEYFFFLFV